jgi:hypothetical protein
MVPPVLAWSTYTAGSPLGSETSTCAPLGVA